MEGIEKTLESAGLFRSWLGQAFNGHLAVAPLVRAAVFVVAFSASAFAACTAPTMTNPAWVCSSTDGGLLRSNPVVAGQTPKSTIDTTSIPAGSKIQSITVSLTWNGDNEPDDWAFNLAGPSNATSLVFYSLIGGFNSFTGSVSFADGHTPLQDAQMVAGTTYSGNISSLTNTSGDAQSRFSCYNVAFGSGSPSTLNYIRTVSRQHGYVREPVSYWNGSSRDLDTLRLRMLYQQRRAKWPRRQQLDPQHCSGGRDFYHHDRDNLGESNPHAEHRDAHRDCYRHDQPNHWHGELRRQRDHHHRLRRGYARNLRPQRPCGRH